MNWRIEKSDFMTDKVSVYEMTLDEFEADPNISDADFEIDPPAGTRVFDENLHRDARTYVVGAPGKPNLPIAEFEANKDMQRSRRNMFIGIGCVLLLLAGGVYSWCRRSES